MFTDYHIHCGYSDDSETPMRAHLEAARKKGITHLCFTDHVDFDGAALPPADIAARNAELEELVPQFPELDISFGAEIGVKDKESFEAAMEHMKDCHLDFIIASVHMVGGIDTCFPSFYDGKTQQQGYRESLETIISSMAEVNDFSVLGHYDFCTKYAPFTSRALLYHDFPELLDELFHMIISKGRAIEINTAAWRDDPSWGLETIKRYRELGGEYITIGSDAHIPEKVGNRFSEALEIAKAAGIPYIATFKNMQPILHKLT